MKRNSVICNVLEIGKSRINEKINGRIDSLFTVNIEIENRNNKWKKLVKYMHQGRHLIE
jgi:hypothetical protein